MFLDSAKKKRDYSKSMVNQLQRTQVLQKAKSHCLQFVLHI